MHKVDAVHEASPFALLVETKYILGLLTSVNGTLVSEPPFRTEDLIHEPLSEVLS